MPPNLYSPAKIFGKEIIPLLHGDMPNWYKAGMENMKLKKWLNACPGPVMAENLGNVVVHGRIPLIGDNLIFFNLVQNKKIDPEPVYTMIKKGEFALILIQRLKKNARIPQEVIDLILEHYRIVDMVSSNYVLIPRAPS